MIRRAFLSVLSSLPFAGLFRNKTHTVSEQLITNCTSINSTDLGWRVGSHNGSPCIVIDVVGKKKYGVIVRLRDGDDSFHIVGIPKGVDVQIYNHNGITSIKIRVWGKMRDCFASTLPHVPEGERYPSISQKEFRSKYMKGMPV